jgi:DNA-binding MarR family transcriptional regulator
MLHRPTDPQTSALAASEIQADGTLGRMEKKALDFIRLDPGSTANEIESQHGLKDGQIRKRLTALEAKGLIYRGPARRSWVTGKVNETWFPVAIQRELF